VSKKKTSEGSTNYESGDQGEDQERGVKKARGGVAAPRRYVWVKRTRGG